MLRHRVTAGETLREIADAYHVTAHDLVLANPEKPARIYRGQPVLDELVEGDFLFIPVHQPHSALS
jgi:hypothetical protein